MKDEKIEKEAINIVRERWANANITGIKSYARLTKFLGGYLTFIEITNAYGKPEYNYVHTKKNMIRRFDDLEDLVNSIESPDFFDRVESLLSNISGAVIIGIMITATLCIGAFKGNSEVIKNLGSALTIVIGFYFGQKTASKENVRGRP